MLGKLLIYSCSDHDSILFYPRIIMLGCVRVLMGGVTRYVYLIIFYNSYSCLQNT